MNTITNYLIQIINSARISRRAANLIGAVTFISISVRAANFFREVIITSHFGANASMDSFWLTQQIPSFLSTVFISPLAAIWIPTMLTVRKKNGLVESEKIAETLLILSFLALLFFSFAMIPISRYVIPLFAHGFSSDTISLTNFLILLSAPLLILQGIGTLLNAHLNLHDSFKIPAISPIFRPSIILIIFYLFGITNVQTLAKITIAAYLAEFLFLLLFSLKYMRFPLHWHGFKIISSDIKLQYFALIGSTIVMGSSQLIDQSMSSMLREGSVSLITYGGKVVNLVTSVIISIVGAVILTHLSKTFLHSGQKKFFYEFRKIISQIFFASLFVTLFLWIAANPIIHMIYGRGNITEDSLERIVTLHRIFSLQIPFYSMSIVCTRAILAMKKNSIIFISGIIGGTLNISLNYLLMKNYEINGIAVSTVVVQCVCFLILFVTIIKNKNAQYE